MVRHGQASFGAADYDELSDLGRSQAAIAGRALAARSLRTPLIVSGTLRRQRDTAAILHSQLRGSLLGATDDRFDEYDHVGMVETIAAESGSTAPTSPRAFQQLLDTALRRWISADTEDGWGGFSRGATEALTDLTATLDEGQDAIVATSGGVIAAVCGELLSLAEPGVVALNRVTVNAAFTTLIAGSSGTNLLTFNDHAHFSGMKAASRTYR